MKIIRKRQSSHDERCELRYLLTYFLLLTEVILKTI